MTTMSGSTTNRTRPVCFAYPAQPVKPYDFSAFAPDEVHAPWNLSDQHIDAFARLIPLLACGEESAIHVFSGAATLASTVEFAHRATHTVSAQALTDIAADEMRHDAWLKAWRAKLPDNLDKATQRKARQFFSGLSNDNPALHFIRIAALDSAVCQILAPLIARDAPLSKIHEITSVLNYIRTDEARHVRISRACAVNWGATPDQIHAEWLNVRSQLVTLLESVGADLNVLGVNPDRLFSRLKHAPAFTVAHTK